MNVVDQYKIKLVNDKWKIIAIDGKENYSIEFKFGRHQTLFLIDKANYDEFGFSDDNAKELFRNPEAEVI